MTTVYGNTVAALERREVKDGGKKLLAILAGAFARDMTIEEALKNKALAQTAAKTPQAVLLKVKKRVVGVVLAINPSRVYVLDEPEDWDKISTLPVTFVIPQDNKPPEREKSRNATDRAAAEIWPRTLRALRKDTELGAADADPVVAMSEITEDLYNSKPNKIQQDFAKAYAEAMGQDFDGPGRVIILPAPPGAGKTACEVFAARWGAKWMGGRRAMVATSLVAVSQQIAHAMTRTERVFEPPLVVRRVDGVATRATGKAATARASPSIYKTQCLDTRRLAARLANDKNIVKDAQALILHKGGQLDNFGQNSRRNIEDALIRAVPVAAGGGIWADVVVGTFEAALALLTEGIGSGETTEPPVHTLIIDEWHECYELEDGLRGSGRGPSAFSLLTAALALVGSGRMNLVLVSATGRPQPRPDVKDGASLLQALWASAPMVIGAEDPWLGKKLRLAEMRPAAKITRAAEAVRALVTNEARANLGAFSLDERDGALGLLVFLDDARDAIRATPDYGLAWLNVVEAAKCVLLCNTREHFSRGAKTGATRGTCALVFIQSKGQQVLWAAAIARWLHREGALPPADRQWETAVDRNLRQDVDACASWAERATQGVLGAADMIRPGSRKRLEEYFNTKDAPDAARGKEAGLGKWVRIAYSRKILCVNADHVRDGYINALIAGPTPPAVIVATSKLGVGVDIEEIGPTVVFPAAAPVSEKRAEQWLGRGYRASRGYSAMVLAVSPANDTIEPEPTTDGEVEALAKALNNVVVSEPYDALRTSYMKDDLPPATPPCVRAALEAPRLFTPVYPLDLVHDAITERRTMERIVSDGFTYIMMGRNVKNAFSGDDLKAVEGLRRVTSSRVIQTALPLVATLAMCRRDTDAKDKEGREKYTAMLGRMEARAEEYDFEFSRYRRTGEQPSNKDHVHAWGAFEASRVMVPRDPARTCGFGVPDATHYMEGLDSDGARMCRRSPVHFVALAAAICETPPALFTAESGGVTNDGTLFADVIQEMADELDVRLCGGVAMAEVRRDRDRRTKTVRVVPIPGIGQIVGAESCRGFLIQLGRALGAVREERVKEAPNWSYDLRGLLHDTQLSLKFGTSPETSPYSRLVVRGISLMRKVVLKTKDTQAARQHPLVAFLAGGATYFVAAFPEAAGGAAASRSFDEAIEFLAREPA